MNVVPIKRHKAFERAEKRSVARTLANAKASDLVEVLVVGVDDAGEVIVTSHPPDPGNALWLMERAKQQLLNL